MKNKYCWYTLFCIMKNTLSCIMTIFILRYISSYIKRNKHYHYTSSHNNKHFHVKINIYFYYISSYIMKNEYCHYTSPRIRRYTFSCIKKCLLSLYIFLYNKK